jgi:hypothetical protein
MYSMFSTTKFRGLLEIVYSAKADVIFVYRKLLAQGRTAMASSLEKGLSPLKAIESWAELCSNECSPASINARI